MKFATESLANQSEPERVSPERIVLQLQKIISSRSFRRATRLRSLLEYVVAKALNGAAHGELQTARDLFGKDADFDPSLDPVVRVQFGRLRRTLSRYFATEGASDPVIITIPGRSYKPVFLRSPAAGVSLSEVLPVVPGERPTTDDVDGETYSTADRGRPPGRPSIAVLPFTNLTNDPKQDAFCYGLTEEISHELASRPAVDVVASSSSFQFKDEPVDVRTAGKELGVPLILEGSVRVEKGNTRVVVQLARTEDGVAVWSDSFDSKMSGSLDTQRTVARKVMNSLPLGA